MPFVFGAALTLAGCGATSTPLTGVFLDSAVSGNNYRTATQSGTTDAAGEFKFISAEQVTFSLGRIVLPTVTAGSVITPPDIAGTLRAQLCCIDN